MEILTLISFGISGIVVLVLLGFLGQFLSVGIKLGFMALGFLIKGVLILIIFGMLIFLGSLFMHWI